MIKTHGKINRRLVIITNERGAADASLTSMMGFALSIPTAIDILIICDDNSLKQNNRGEPTDTSAIETIKSTARKYGFEVSVELYCKQRMLTMKDDIDNKKGLTMVLLSPSLNKSKVFDLSKILKEVSVPVWQYRYNKAAALGTSTEKEAQHE
ncbi:MAG: hypothetical protein HQK99_16540 [Nitrospirae bacterium]|nr:hypothetical protein [Nitrospirota bacterium]